MGQKTSNNQAFYKKAWFWVIVVVVAIGVGGAIAANKGPEKVGTTDGNNTSSDATTTRPETKEFSVGDVISFEGAEVAVTSVERGYSTDSVYFTPKEGKEYVKVNISIKNPGAKNLDYNALYWRIQDSVGSLNSYADAMFAQADDGLGSGSLVAGGEKTGSIVFEVPAGDTGLKLHYAPSLLDSNKEVIIAL